MKRPWALLVLVAASLCAVCRQSFVSGFGASAYYLLDPERLVSGFPPPPTVGSEMDAQDLRAVRQWQLCRTDAECSRAKPEALEPDFDTFFGRINPFPEPLPRPVDEFFDHVQEDTFHTVDLLKNRYIRARPYRRDAALRPCIPALDGRRDSYPSGHAALAWEFGLVLGDLVPARRDEFLQRAQEIGWDRVIGGVHHPSDVRAGRLLAEQLHAELLRQPRFLTDLEKLRRLLGR